MARVSRRLGGEVANRANVAIESLEREGRGVGRIDGKTIFVEGALPGEHVEVEIVRDKPTYAIGRALRIERESAMRVTPRCAFFGVCGGCSMQHLDARAQVAIKQRVLEDALERIGQVEAEAMLPPVYGSAWGYRHRARLSVRLVPKKGGVLVGFHEKKSSYVADMTDCEVLPKSVAAMLAPLRALVQGLERPDRMPQIEVAVGDRVTVLVFRVLETLAAADEALLRAFADRHGVQIWLQPKGPESARPFHPDNAPPLDYVLGEFDVRIGFLPTDFTQVNHAVNGVLVRRAMGLLAPEAGEPIADLFCGLGNFTLPIARSGAMVTGIEGNAGLVARARANAAANGLVATFGVANLFEPDQIPDLRPFRKLLIDPPREGAVEVVKRIDTAAGPRRIVYVSCDPATLARDAGVLVHTRGFALRAAGVVNMFPHTSHVESIALFERA